MCKHRFGVQLLQNPSFVSALNNLVWDPEGRPAELIKTTCASLLRVLYFMIGTILAEIPCCIGEVKRVPRPRH
jgi:hypothetical protein